MKTIKIFITACMVVIELMLTVVGLTACYERPDEFQIAPAGASKPSSTTISPTLAPTPALTPLPTPTAIEAIETPPPMRSVTLEGEELARLEDLLEPLSYVLAYDFPENVIPDGDAYDIRDFFGANWQEAALDFALRMTYSDYLQSDWLNSRYSEFYATEVDMQDIQSLFLSAFGFAPDFEGIVRTAFDDSMTYQVIDDMLYIQGEINDTSENKVYIASAQALDDLIVLEAYYLDIAYAGMEGLAPEYEGAYRFLLEKNEGMFGYEIVGVTYLDAPTFAHVTTNFALSDTPDPQKLRLSYDYDDSYIGEHAERYHGYYHNQVSPGCEVGDWLLFESDVPQTLHGFALTNGFSHSDDRNAARVSSVTLEFSDGSIIEATPYSMAWYDYDRDNDWDWGEYGIGFGVIFDHPIVTTSVMITVNGLVDEDDQERSPIELIQFF